jgi:hypothetical protein
MKTCPLYFLALIFLSFFTVHAAAEAAQAPLVAQVSRARFEVSRSAVEREFKDPIAQLSTFRAMPSFASGFFSGITVSKFSEDCLLPQFGLREGDTVEMVNGQPIRGPSDILEVGERLAKEARPGSKIRVHLRRGDQDLVQSYLVVK